MSKNPASKIDVVGAVFRQFKEEEAEKTDGLLIGASAPRQLHLQGVLVPKIQNATQEAHHSGSFHVVHESSEKGAVFLLEDHRGRCVFDAADIVCHASDG